MTDYPQFLIFNFLLFNLNIRDHNYPLTPLTVARRLELRRATTLAKNALVGAVFGLEGSFFDTDGEEAFPYKKCKELFLIREIIWA